MLPPDPRQLAVSKLTAHLAGLLRPSTSDLTTQAALSEAGLRPTETGAYYAAQSAVTALLAFDAGWTGPGGLLERYTTLPPAYPELAPPAAEAVPAEPAPPTPPPRSASPGAPRREKPPAPGRSRSRRRKSAARRRAGRARRAIRTNARSRAAWGRSRPTAGCWSTSSATTPA